MESAIRIRPIDFSKPWWHLILAQRWYMVGVIVCATIRDVFFTLEPFLVAVVLERASWHFFGLACGIWAFAELNYMIMPYFNARFQLSTIHSTFFNAHHYLLTVDPQYHVKRSSGAILAKIERAARGYEDVLDQITFEFAPLIIGIITVFIVLIQYSVALGLIMGGFLCGMLAYGYYFARYKCQKWENAFIASDDDFKATAFENLAQINLIRSCFATDYMENKLRTKITQNTAIEHDLWFSYSFTYRIFNVLYTISILVLVAFFIHRIQLGITPLSHAVGIILAYIQCTHTLIKILHPLRRYMRGITAIKDLYESMCEFGTQTIPLFESAPHAFERTPEVLSVERVVFGYNEARLFDGHSLHLSGNNNHSLYGLIGPSGVGKTTLLSILGGQLKPLQGTVKINGIDIYAVGDVTRRHLITVQGQTATSVKGTVRYNMLFGLPENHGYTDAYLHEVLDRIGMKTVLEEHHGLDTLLGEGALNISGGQRQRLNFAGLYLRARFYKPVLVLIDEPTSSLDEISELAVTHMINELAEHSITIVIAHRLKTLESAQGLIDLSLIKNSKEIKAYTPHELKEHSEYFKRLEEGSEEL